MTCTLPFEPCSDICISGQICSGKTRWVYKIMKNLRYIISSDPPILVLYCFSIHQDLFDDMERTIPNFISKRGQPSSEEIHDFTRDKRHKLIIVDDLMHEVMRNKDMKLLFKQRTHHKCVSVILIIQNPNPGGKHAGTITLNTWYMLLLKILCNVSQVSILRRLLHPGKSKGFLQAFEDALRQR